jgi:hypothetical protein
MTDTVLNFEVGSRGTNCYILEKAEFLRKCYHNELVTSKDKYALLCLWQLLHSYSHSRKKGDLDDFTSAFNRCIFIMKVYEEEKLQHYDEARAKAKRDKDKRAKEKTCAEEAKRKAVLATLPSKQEEYTQFIRKKLGSFLTTVSFGECKETEHSVCFEYKFGFTWRFPRESAKNYILKLAANGTPIEIVENVLQ